MFCFGSSVHPREDLQNVAGWGSVLLNEMVCTLGENKVFVMDLFMSFGVCCLLFAWKIEVATKKEWKLFGK